MLELADRHDLGSCAERRVGSSPTVPTVGQLSFWKEELTLKIESLPREDHQVNLIVEVDPAQMEKAKRKAARKISERSKIPGFRPGKAPYDVVKRYYGDGAITEEAVEVLVDQIYPDVLKEAGIQPGAAGSLENIEKTGPADSQIPCSSRSFRGPGRLQIGAQAL